MSTTLTLPLHEVAFDQNSTFAFHLTAVERVVQTMRTRLCESLSLEDMADIACLSPYYFSRIFHQIIGLPPGEFLAAQRLQTAKHLLLTTSLSVTDVCFEVGYIGLGSFTTRFTQLVGVSPRQLRHIASNGPMSSLEPILAPSDPLPTLSSNRRIEGRIRALSPFQGMIYLGLFPKALPQGKPVRCTALTQPGPFVLEDVPPGSYYAMSAAFPFSSDPLTYLLQNKGLLVAVQGPLLVGLHGYHELVEMVLRPPRWSDPPIVTALPFI